MLAANPLVIAALHAALASLHTAASYAHIAASLGRAPSEVLFVSDVARELALERLGDLCASAEAALVAGVDEPLVGRGPAVALLHRVPEDAVVAPVVRAVEAVDREQLDEIHAEVQPPGRDQHDLGDLGARGGAGAGTACEADQRRGDVAGDAGFSQLR